MSERWRTPVPEPSLTVGGRIGAFGAGAVTTDGVVPGTVVVGGAVVVAAVDVGGAVVAGAVVVGNVVIAAVVVVATVVVDGSAVDVDAPVERSAGAVAAPTTKSTTPAAPAISFRDGTARSMSAYPDDAALRRRTLLLRPLARASVVSDTSVSRGRISFRNH